MLNSNFASRLLLMTAFSAMLSILSGGLVGCSLPQPQNRETENASFTLDNKEPKFSETQTLAGFSIPQARTLHIETCVKDLKMQKSVINHRFVITGGQKEVEAITDANGCLNWDESISFNYFADAKFITLDRHLEAKGFQKGARFIHLAVNPWESQVFDLDKTKIKNLVSSADATAALEDTAGSSPKSVIASDLRVNITEKQTTQNGTTLSMEIRGAPSIEIKKASGELTTVSLTSGTFRAQIFLIHTVAKGSAEQRTELFRSNPLFVQATNGQLSIHLPITLPPNCVRGQYQLGFKLQPAAPEGSRTPKILSQLKPFEGMYYLSECEQIKGNFFAVLTNEASQKKQDFSIENYLNEVSTLHENISKDSPSVQATEGFQQMGYEFSKLSVSDYAYTNQEPLLRQREFLLRSCVFSGIDSKPLRAQNFTIKKANGSTEQNIRSNNQGCIEWKDSVSFNYFDQECKKPYTVQISNKDLGINKSIPLLINPWSSNSNAIEDISSTQMKPRCANGQSELRTNQFEFTKSKFNYSVDEFLNLKVQKTGLMSIGLTIKRPSLTEPSGFEETSAPYGQYRVKLALVDVDADPSANLQEKVFMISEKVITLSGQSSLVDEMSIEAISLKEMGNTNKVWIEISPLKNADVFKPITFQGTFRFSDETASGNLRELQTQISMGSPSLIERARQAFLQDQIEKNKKFKQIATKSFSAQELGLTLINLNVDPDFKKLGARLNNQKNSIKAWLQSSVLPQDLAKQFCFSWINERLQGSQRKDNYNSMTALNECMQAVARQPEHFFDIQYRYFAKNPQVPSQQQESVQLQDFAMSNAFNNGSSYVSSHSINDSMDVGFGIGTGKWFGLSASTGYRHSISWAKQWGTQMATNQSTTGSISLKVEKISLKIKAESLEKCAIIKLRPENYMNESSSLRQTMDPRLSAREQLKVLSHGLMFCSGDSTKTPMTFVENYYIMNQFFVGSQASDSSSNKNRPYFIALRGDEDFAQFISLVHEGTSIPDSYQGDFQRKDLLKSRYSYLFLRGLPGSPGQFISPR